MEPEPFIIDLNDPADLAAKHRKAVAIVTQLERDLAEVQALERRIAQWQARAAFLASQLPEAPSEPVSAPPDRRRERNDGLNEMVTEVVNREIRPIKAKEVHAVLTAEGHDVTPSSVSNALHYAAHGAKKIQTAPGRGMYAPLAYKIEPSDATVQGATGSVAERYGARPRPDWSGGIPNVTADIGGTQERR